MFLLEANKNSLIVLEHETITSGSVNVYSVRFRFNADWDGMDKVAVFRSGGDPVSVLLDSSGGCQIPWEVMQRCAVREKLYAGVYGVMGDNIVLPTLWALLGTVMPGAEPGDNAVPPTPGLVEQALAQVSADRSAAESAADRAEEAAERAEKALGEAAWIAFELDEEGNLWAVTAPGFEGAAFALAEDGYLEVIYGA